MSTATPRPQEIFLPKEVFLRDYAAPSFEIEEVSLELDLHETKTRVVNRMVLRRTNPGIGPDASDLHLNGGVGIDLISVALDGEVLPEGHVLRDGEVLTIRGVPDQFRLRITSEIDPSANTALSGLYTSGGNFCTQCEAEGFRNITFYLDRPDVMSRFKVRLEADAERYPVLLSNGNMTDEGGAEDGRHFAVWEDPYPKPAYLFALVAGDLGCLEDSFTTHSGREVTLRIFAADNDISKCRHAMDSLKRSMAWDEDTFGLEYDLDIYNIVAVGDFNMGAMENKSLNVFNTKYVLATKDTATDRDFDAVEGVIAHEYFHNWTGNRVTCRDWFQLSLKEGLTVFRDQEYSSDMGSRALKRIEDVRVLRGHQFPEDSGPMAHPVRPASYIEINNFYTATVYNKGAEVIRMMHRIIGAESFRKGMDLYFERHDGQAVTCDDFAAAMEDASGVDLKQFRLWYAQAGTPTLEVSSDYDEATAEFNLHVRQSCPVTPGQPDKKPMHIPLAVGLLGPDGDLADAELHVGGERVGNDFLLQVHQAEQSFHFKNVTTRPVPSLLRGFSAPVHLKSDQSRDDLLFLLANDSDSFARWEAGQKLAVELILGLVEDRQAGRALEIDQSFSDAIAVLIADENTDPALIAEALTLPSEIYIGQMMDRVDVDGIHEAREFVLRQLADTYHDQWLDLYRRLATNEPYGLSAAEKARRALRNVALAYLMKTEGEDAEHLCTFQARGADNMTDSIAALSALAGSESDARGEALENFYRRWRMDPLVIDKWFAIQAASPRKDTLDAVRELAGHEAFTLGNPNRVRSLVSAFSMLNPARFHDASGGGYAFLADTILELDGPNPQLAARLMSPLTQWRRYDDDRQALMKAELQRILETPKLSKDTYELAKKSLD